MIQDWFARFGYKCCNKFWKLKGRLDKKPEHLKQHNNILQDQLKKEVVEVVEEKPSDEKSFEGGMMHLPHREVTCEDKYLLNYKLHTMRVLKVKMVLA